MKRNKGIQSLGIGIMVLALTILACQGVGGFNPFATATPTTTATFTPSPTPTLTPTSTPTSTPLPTGKSKEEQADGTTLFTDYDGGYQLTFPQGWAVVIPEEDDLDKMFSNIPEQGESVSKLIEMAKSADVSQLIRVFGFNFKAQQGAYTPNVNISYNTNGVLRATPLKDLINAMVAYYPTMGVEVTHSETTKTSSGMEIGIIEAGLSMKGVNGEKISLAQKQVFFKSGEGVAIIAFSTVKNADIDLSEDLSKLIESIQLLQ